ncbi:hypothetical protein AMELA_G00264050 [Ameiurus melas]|uniref:Protein FAM208B n=1 Tax=Ameiurus melas TaxID=219545 RepID=A0A7J5ZSA3_AMEME|nr:hypothetical protein AMELA_G00264050 [Ameiurus melas]
MSPLTGVIKAEPYETKDSSIQGTTEEAADLAILNANVRKEPRMLEKGTDQRPLIPTICARSAAKRDEMYDNFDSMDASPPALQIDTEAEMNSRCCTPTLDEPPYSQLTDEVSDFQEVNLQDIAETEHYCLKKSSTNTWLVLDSSEDSQSEVEKSPAHRDQIFPQDPCWSPNKCDATIKETDESKPLVTDKHVPEENLDYFDYDAIPTPRKTEEKNMTHLLKNYKPTSRVKPQRRLNISPVENPMTIQFSRLEEQNSFSALDQTLTTLSKFKINVDMTERKALKKTPNYSKPLHLQSLFCERGTEAACSKVSDITKECTKSYNTMMNDICIGKTIPHQNDELKRKWDIERASTSKQSGFCGRIKKDMFDYLHDNLNAVVRQACKTKYKFYILVTSVDPFFEETKDLLEAEGHTAIEPYQFDFYVKGQTPVLIILRNEDIAEHIFEVPHLLELKKSSRVLFAGIDQPDDVVNLTHQELFAKGGFVVFDETALYTLNLENIKKVVGIMEELDKKGKWKWFLHYRDSRKLRESARCSPEAQRRKQFIDCCQEAGIVEVLPYHECDVISRDRPDYLRCLVHLQIQNISARFPVFVTDTPDDCFEKNGILTMNIYTFSRILSNDTCSIS